MFFPVTAGTFFVVTVFCDPVEGKHERNKKQDDDKQGNKDIKPKRPTGDVFDHAGFFRFCCNIAIDDLKIWKFGDLKIGPLSGH